MPVSPAPLPAKPVAVKIPVLGTKESLVEVVFCGRLPVLAVTQVGYTEEALVVSSVIPVVVALPALPEIVV